MSTNRRPAPNDLLAWLETPVGTMAAAATEAGLCRLVFADPAAVTSPLAALPAALRERLLPADGAVLAQLRAELAEYFAGTRRAFEVPLETPGTDFQQRVWAALRHIPYGETCSYADIARAIGQPKAVRAVGHANGQNRVAIVIPCHRVINADGRLGGYGGGVARKAQLLAVEGVLLSG